MNCLDRIVRWSSLVAIAGLACVIPMRPSNAAETKPFKETGSEHFVTEVAPGSFKHPHFVNARALYGPEVFTGVILHVAQNNAGGACSSLAMETVHLDATAPQGVVVYAIKYETVITAGTQTLS